MLGQGEKMRPQFRQRHLGVNRLAIADDVEIRLLEVDDAMAAGSLDEGFLDRPFIRHGPVEHARPRRHFGDLKRHDFRQSSHGRA